MNKASEPSRVHGERPLVLALLADLFPQLGVLGLEPAREFHGLLELGILAHAEAAGRQRARQSERSDQRGSLHARFTALAPPAVMPVALPVSSVMTQ